MRGAPRDLGGWRHLVTHCQGSALEMAVGVVWGVCSVSWWGSLPTSQAVGSEHGSGCGMLLLGSSPWRQGILCGPDGASGSSLSPRAAAILLSPQPLGSPWSKVSGKALLCLLWSRSLGKMTLTPPGKGGLILPQLTSGICFGWEMSLDAVLASGTGVDPQYWQNPWGRGTVLCPHQCYSCSGQLGTLRQGMG